MENFKNKHDFIMTGRFTSADEFQKKNPEAPLLPECTDVVSYSGGHYIQVMKSGAYLVRGNFSEHTILWESEKLSDAEDNLWKEFFEKY